MNNVQKESNSGNTVDYLTGFANRKGLCEYYDSLPKDAVLHVMFIDIDNFQQINDKFGYTIGDELLAAIGHLIEENVQGFLMRMGGDEYMALIDGSVPKERVIEMADNLIGKYEDIPFRRDILLMVSLSMGIVLNQKAGYALDDVLAKCSQALYQAKYDGKHRYVVYKESAEDVNIDRNIEAEMENALKEGQFQLYMQPKVNMVTNELCGAEALSRWKHPVDGIRPPIMYIPLFEKNGFISKLDMYMYEQVCMLKASWAGKKYEHIPVSVNMSRFHLYNPKFPQTLAGIADRYGINRGELEIEVTESVFMKESDTIIKMVTELRELGFMVSIDDFGSGFSSLNLLRDIPVNTIKIDKEFLKITNDGVKGKKIVKNVIAMCRDLKLDVITEGIETREHIDFITSCGCQKAQGFYYSKPLPVDQFEKFGEDNVSEILDRYNFRFNGNLKTEDGSLEGSIAGQGLRYEDGIFKDSKSIYFPGGLCTENIVELPEKAIVNDSFAVSMWIKPEEVKPWVAAMYIKFESGFMGIVPLNAAGKADFRIRYSREVNTWFDIEGEPLEVGRWSQFAIVYNAETEQEEAYINGELIGMLSNVPVNRYVKRIVVGGDIFQESFKGNISDVVVYNEAKDQKFMREQYETYVNDGNFVK